MGKSLAKNSFYNILFNLFKIIFPLIYSAYASRILLAEGIGRVSFAQNIVTYFTIIAALGLPNYGTREISKIKNDSNQINIVFSELFSINAISTIICVLVYYLFVFNSDFLGDDRVLFSVVGLNIVFNFINVDWFYQGLEEYSYIAKRSFVIKIISLLCIFVFVKTKKDYIIYALIFSLALGGNNIFNILRLRRFSVRFSLSNLNYKRHLKPVLVLLSTAIAIELYTLLDTTMLGRMCSTEIVGYYTNSMRVVKVLITVITATGGVLLPRLSYYVSTNQIEECNKVLNKIFNVMLYLYIPCGIGMFMTANLIVPVLFGESFLPAIKTLRIASMLVFALGFSNLFGTQILLTFNEEKKLLMCTIVGAGINIIMNLVLIPLYYQNGAAVASVISEAIVTLMTYLFSKKYVKILFDGRFVCSMIVSVFFMSIMVYMINYLSLDIYTHLFVSLFIGALSYFSISFFMKNPIFMDLLLMIKQKFRR